MTERPILFSGPMVRELLAGRKTQTRRPVKPQPVDCGEGVYADRYNGGPEWAFWLPDNRMTEPRTWRCPYGAPGERLWVRETFSRERLSVYPCPTAWYRADLADHQHARHPEDGYCSDGELDCLHGIRWTPAIHMPRRLSRLSLEVTTVRVERLDAITEEDARSEGMAGVREAGDSDLRYTFRRLWSSLYSGGPFDGVLNPWVWVVTFQRVGASGA